MKKSFSNNNEFTLLKHDGVGEVIEQQHQGVSFMEDNGCLSWLTTITPMKHDVAHKCIRFSEFLELVRKDVECTFGILKGRFFILRCGVRARIIDRCDEI